MSNFILLWSEKILFMMPISLNVLALYLWHNIWLFLENVPGADEKDVYTVVWG
jgi:hypothetical protein